MKSLFLLISLIFLSGCGKALKEYTIVEEAKAYVGRWESIYGIRVNENVVFGPLPSKVVGTCSNSGVTLDKTYWDNSSDLGREQLLFHELGHCLLGLGHDSGKVDLVEPQVPKSTMYPYAFGNSVEYADNVNYYHDELKNSRANERSTVNCETKGE